MIVQVAMPVPIYQLFDYLIEDEHCHMATHDFIGCRVLASFGPRQCVGLIVSADQEIDYELSKVKPIIELMDLKPIFDTSMLALARWLSDYYIHPLGDVISTMLPVLMRKQAKVDMPEQTFLQLKSNSSAQTDILLARSKQQRSLYQLLLNGPKLLSHIKQTYAANIVKALLDKGLAVKYSQALSSENWQSKIELAEKPRPNMEQAMAIANIVESSGFNAFLLEGVTGSGKTEVYLQIIEPMLLVGKQVLILVPEIGLTPQTVSRFEARFGIQVGVLHSNLNDKERAIVWKQANEGKIGIIIGTRSSIFTALKSPGMIIVDEEHDESFKQQDGLRYHARDVAAYRAKQLDIPLVLGSATPSLESLNNALGKKFRHLMLKQRAGDANMPTQLLMDMRNQSLQCGIAQGLLDRVKAQLEQGNQVMVFVNRRGFAPAMLCHQCGHVESCNSCDSPYTVHKAAHNLQCHRCGHAKPIPRKCKACGHHELETEGLGTEQIQQGLEQIFPDYKSVRIDSDSVRGKGKLAKLLADINRNQYQLLIGTQILSKGHHFPNVTMVLILNVDGALFSADYRAAEKLAQLITQLAGRAGRSEKPGEMWLQTHNPQHPLLQDLINNGYADFARFALLERKHARLPPFEFQVAIRAESKFSGQAKTLLNQCLSIFNQFQKLKALGPFPAFIEKRQDRYRFVLIVQSASRHYLSDATKQVVMHIQQQPEAKRIKWYVDVNPIDFS